MEQDILSDPKAWAVFGAIAALLVVLGVFAFFQERQATRARRSKNALAEEEAASNKVAEAAYHEYLTHLGSPASRGSLLDHGVPPPHPSSEVAMNYARDHRIDIQGMVFEAIFAACRLAFADKQRTRKAETALRRLLIAEASRDLTPEHRKALDLMRQLDVPEDSIADQKRVTPNVTKVVAWAAQHQPKFLRETLDQLNHVDADESESSLMTGKVTSDRVLRSEIARSINWIWRQENPNQ